MSAVTEDVGVVVDAFRIPGVAAEQTILIRGDCRSFSVAAASIVAKVVRDRIMTDLDAVFAEFGFARHKGYGTSEHLAALRRLGPCPIHRRSFLGRTGSRHGEG